VGVFREELVVVEVEVWHSHTIIVAEEEAFTLWHLVAVAVADLGFQEVLVDLLESLVDKTAVLLLEMLLPVLEVILTEMGEVESVLIKWEILPLPKVDLVDLEEIMVLLVIL
jgi:hypothetical protein